MEPVTYRSMEERKDSVGTAIAKEVNRELKETEEELKALKEINCDFGYIIGQQQTPLNKAEQLSQIAQQKIKEGDLALERAEEHQTAIRKKSVWLIPVLGVAGLVVGTVGFAFSIPAGLITMGVFGASGAGGGAVAAFK